MKKLLFLFISIIFFISCEDSSITGGRNTYKKYFKETLKDPESLKIYHEKVEKVEKENACIFTVDYGAKNGYGAYSRETIIFKTMVNGMLLYVNGELYLSKYD